MKTVRQQILEFIRTHRSVTAAELSSAFRTSPANARHHLAILMEQGLVEAVDLRPATGKGRPSRVFAISRQAAGENLDLLASALLEQQRECLTATDTDSDMDLLAEGMARRLQPADPLAASGPVRNLTRALNQLTQALNRHHYASRWEAHPGNPHLILGNCPYRSIIADHPELCRMDAGIIRHFLHAPVKQEAKLKRDPSGLPYCLFLIGKEQV